MLVAFPTFNSFSLHITKVGIIPILQRGKLRLQETKNTLWIVKWQF